MAKMSLDGLTGAAELEESKRLLKGLEDLVTAVDALKISDNIEMYVDQVNNFKMAEGVRRDLFNQMFNSILAAQKKENARLTQEAKDFIDSFGDNGSFDYKTLERASFLTSGKGGARKNSAGEDFIYNYSQIQSIVSKAVNKSVQEHLNNIVGEFTKAAVGGRKPHDIETEELVKLLKSDVVEKFVNSSSDVQSGLNPQRAINVIKAAYGKELGTRKGAPKGVVESIVTNGGGFDELRRVATQRAAAQAAVKNSSYDTSGGMYKGLVDEVQKLAKRKQDMMIRALRRMDTQEFQVLEEYLAQDLKLTEQELAKELQSKKMLTQTQAERASRNVMNALRSGVTKGDIVNGGTLGRIMMPNRYATPGTSVVDIAHKRRTATMSMDAYSGKISKRARNDHNFGEFVSGKYIAKRLGMVYDSDMDGYTATQDSSKAGTSTYSVTNLLSRMNDEAKKKGLNMFITEGEDGGIEVSFKGNSGAGPQSEFTITGPKFAIVKGRDGKYGYHTIRNGMMSGNQFIMVPDKDGVNTTMMTSTEYGLLQGYRALQAVNGRVDNAEALRKFKYQMKLANESAETGMSADSARYSDESIRKEFFEFNGSGSSQTRQSNLWMTTNINPVIESAFKKIDKSEIEGFDYASKEKKLAQDLFLFVSTVANASDQQKAIGTFDNSLTGYLYRAYMSDDPKKSIRPLVENLLKLKYETQFGSNNQINSGVIQMRANLERASHFIGSDVSRHETQTQAGVQLSADARNARKMSQRVLSHLTTKFALNSGFDLNNEEEALYTRVFMSEKELTDYWNKFIATDKGKKYANNILPSLLGDGAIIREGIRNELVGTRERNKKISDVDLFNAMRAVGLDAGVPIDSFTDEQIRQVIGKIMHIDQKKINLGSGGIFSTADGGYTLSFDEIVDNTRAPKTLGGLTGIRAIGSNLPSEFFKYIEASYKARKLLKAGESIDIISANGGAGINDYGGLIAAALARAVKLNPDKIDELATKLNADDSAFKDMFEVVETNGEKYLSATGKRGINIRGMLDFLEKNKDLTMFDPTHLVVSEMLSATNEYEYKKDPKYGLKEKSAEIRAIQATATKNGTELGLLLQEVESDYTSDYIDEAKETKESFMYALKKSFKRAANAEKIDDSEAGIISVGYGKDYDINLADFGDEAFGSLNITGNGIEKTAFDNSILGKISELVEKRKSEGAKNAYIRIGNGEYAYKMSDRFGNEISGNQMYVPVESLEEKDVFEGDSKNYIYDKSYGDTLGLLRALKNLNDAKTDDEKIIARQRLEATQKEMLLGLNESISSKKSGVQSDLYSARLNTGKSYEMISMAQSNPYDNNTVLITEAEMRKRIKNARLTDFLFNEWGLTKDDKQTKLDAVIEAIKGGRTLTSRLNRVPSISGRDIKYVKTGITNEVDDDRAMMTNAMAAAIRGDFDGDHAQLTLISGLSAKNEDERRTILEQAKMVEENDKRTVDVLEKYGEVYADTPGVFSKKNGEWDLKQPLTDDVKAFVSATAQKNRSEIGMLSVVNSNVRNMLTNLGYDEGGSAESLIMGRMTNYLLTAVEQDAISYKHVVKRIQDQIAGMDPNISQAEKDNAMWDIYKNAMTELSTEIGRIFDKEDDYGISNILDSAISGGIIKTAKEGDFEFTTSADIMRTLSDMVSVNPQDVLRVLEEEYGIGPESLGYIKNGDDYVDVLNNATEFEKIKDKYGKISVSGLKAGIKSLDRGLKELEKISIIPQPGFNRTALNMEYRYANDEKTGDYAFIKKMIAEGAEKTSKKSDSDNLYYRILAGKAPGEAKYKVLKQLFEMTKGTKINGKEVTDDDLKNELYKIQSGVYDTYLDSPILAESYKKLSNTTAGISPNINQVATTATPVVGTVPIVVAAGPQVPDYEGMIAKATPYGVILNDVGHTYSVIGGEGIAKENMISGSKFSNILFGSPIEGNDSFELFSKKFMDNPNISKVTEYTDVYPGAEGSREAERNFNNLRNTWISSKFGTFQHMIREYSSAMLGRYKKGYSGDNIYEDLLNDVFGNGTLEITDPSTIFGVKNIRGGIGNAKNTYKELVALKSKIEGGLDKLGYTDLQKQEFFDAARISAMRQMTLAGTHGYESILQEYSGALKIGDKYFGGSMDDFYQDENGYLVIGDTKNKKHLSGTDQVLQVSLYGRVMRQILGEVYKEYAKGGDWQKKLGEYGINSGAAGKFEKTLKLMSDKHLTPDEIIKDGIITNYNPGTGDTSQYHIGLLNDFEMDRYFGAALKGETLDQEEAKALKDRLQLYIGSGESIMIRGEEGESKMNIFDEVRDDPNKVKEYTDGMKALEKRREALKKLEDAGYSSANGEYTALKDSIDKEQQRLDTIFEGFSEYQQNLIKAENVADNKISPDAMYKNLGALNKASDSLGKKMEDLEKADEKDRDSEWHKNYDAIKNRRATIDKDIYRLEEQLAQQSPELYDMYIADSYVAGFNRTRKQAEMSEKDRIAYETKKIRDFKSLLQAQKRVAKIANGEVAGYSDEDIEMAKQLSGKYQTQIDSFVTDDMSQQLKDKLAETKLTTSYRPGGSSGNRGFLGRLGDLVKGDIAHGLSYLFRGGIAIRGFQKIIQSFQKVIQLTMQLDSVMTNLRIVTGENADNARTLIKRYNELGKEVGATTVEAAKAGETWLRQGYNIQQSMELAKSSIYLAKLGFMDMGQATKSLTSLLKGFGLEASDSMSVVDKLTTLDASYATTAGDLSNAISNTAAVAKSAGMDLDSTAAALTAIIDTTQMDSGAAGNAMKTILSRFGNVKAGAFTKLMNGESDDTTDAINDVEKVLNSLGIRLRTSTYEMRDFDDVLNDLAEKWSSLSDVERNAVSTAMAGTRQRNSFEALMDNYDTYQDALEKTQNSNGTAAMKYAMYMESVEASLKNVQNAWENLTLRLGQNHTLKAIVDLSAKFVEELDGMLAAIVSITTLASSLKLTGVIGGKLNLNLVKEGGLNPIDAFKAKGTDKIKALTSWDRTTAAGKGLMGGIGALGYGLGAFMSGGNSSGYGLGGLIARASDVDLSKLNAVDTTTGEKLAYGLVGGAITGLGTAFGGPIGGMIASFVSDAAVTGIKIALHKEELRVQEESEKAQDELEKMSTVGENVGSAIDILSKGELDAEDYRKLGEYQKNLIDDYNTSSQAGMRFAYVLDKLVGSSTNVKEKLDLFADSTENTIDLLRKYEAAKIEAEARLAYEASAIDRYNTRKEIYDVDNEYTLAHQWATTDDEKQKAKLRAKFDKKYGKGAVTIEQASAIYDSKVASLDDAERDFDEELLKAGISLSGVEGLNNGDLYGRSIESVSIEIAKEWAKTMVNEGRNPYAVFDRNGKLTNYAQSKILSSMKQMDNMSTVFSKQNLSYSDLLNQSNNISGQYGQRAIDSVDALKDALMYNDDKAIGMVGAILQRNVSAKDIDALRDLLFNFDENKVATLAHSFNMTEESLRGIGEDLWWLTAGDQTATLDAIVGKFENFASALVDVAKSGKLSAESLTKLNQLYPQIYQMMMKNGGITTSSLIDALTDTLTSDNGIYAMAGKVVNNFLNDQSLYSSFKNSVDWADFFGKEISEEQEKVLKNEANTFADIMKYVYGNNTAMKNLSDLFVLNSDNLDYASQILEIYESAATRLIDSEISGLESLKESLEDTNQLRQKELDLVKARIALEEAQNKKVRVYRAGVGFTYQADQQAIKEAQDNVDRLEREKSQDNIQLQIDMLNQQKEIISSLNSEETYRMQDELLSKYLGDGTVNIGKRLEELTSYFLNKKFAEDVRESVENTGTEQIEEASMAYDAANKARENYDKVSQDFEANKYMYRDMNEYNDAKKRVESAYDAAVGAYNTYNGIMESNGFNIDNIGKTEELSKINDIRNIGNLEYMPLQYMASLGGYDSNGKNAGIFKLGNTVQDASRGVQTDTIDVGNYVLSNFNGYKLDGNKLIPTGPLDKDEGYINGEQRYIFYNGKLYSVKPYGGMSWHQLQDRYGSNMKDMYAVRSIINEVDDITGYYVPRNATGSTSFSGGATFVNEKGLEGIITPEGTLTSLPAKSGILPADLTKNLWTLGEIAPNLIARMQNITLKPSGSSNNEDNSIHVNQLHATFNTDAGFNSDVFWTDVKNQILLTKNQ